MSDGAQTSRLAVLVFTDVVGSSELKTRLGVLTYAKLLARHDALFRELLEHFPSAEVIQDTGDGFFAAFQTVGDAVRFALRFQDAMHREPWGTAEPFQTRVGIHLGELAHVAGPAGGSPKVVGIAADLTQRVMSLACGGQILLTRAAFDEARQFVSEYPAVNGQTRALRWMAHGDYLFHGAAEPVQVFEVGGDGIAPLSPPRDREKARRQRSEENKDEILGWRPAVGLAVPQAPAWVLEKKLGEGTFGEVWLAHNSRLHQTRVFKFCFDAQRLESFKRELTLFRLLRDALGERPDIARLHEVCFDRPPFFLETEYAPAGNLIDWAAAQGGLDRVPLSTRLEIVAQVCDAVAAAHSVGVLHKDIKPSNILMHAGRNGSPPRPQLADFGIGLLTDKGQLAAHHITEAGFTSVEAPAESSRSGTRIYMPPEAMVGRPFTIQGDIYALGILLYQMAVADLTRPMALGWERDVADELLREDIAACVDGDPARRVNSAAEIAQRLRGLTGRRQKRRHDTELREHARRRRRHLRLAAGVSVALAFAMLLAVVGYLREKRMHDLERQLRLRAEDSERATQLAYASGSVDEGLALHMAGRAQPSREALIRASDTFRRFGAATEKIDVGLFRSFREFDAPIQTIDAASGGLMAVVWLPDGIRAASSGDDGSVRLWDARSGVQLRSFTGHKGLVGALAISPDGRQLLSGGKDGMLRLWDIQRGDAPLRTLEGSEDEIRGAAFSPDGQFAVSGTYGIAPAVRLWRLDSGACIRTIPSPNGLSIYGVNFSPDGRRMLATTYGNGDVFVWDVEGDRPPMRLPGSGQYVIAATFSPDGQSILTSVYDNTLKLWDAATGKLRATLTGHSAGVRGACFIGRDGNRAISCSMDGTLKVWDLTRAEAVRTFAGHTKGVRGLSVSSDGRRAISAGADDTLRVWDLGPNHEVPSSADAAPITALATTSDANLLVSGTRSGVVTLRDLYTLKVLKSFPAHDRPIDCAVLLTTGNLFTADDGGAATVWDVEAARPLRAFAPRVNTARFEKSHSSVAADGSIALSSREKLIDVWSPASGALRHTLEPAISDVTCVALSPDATRALSGDKSGRFYYWDVGSGKRLFRSIPKKTGTIDAIAFSQDGTYALSGGHDNLVHVWDLAAERKILPFEGHTGVIRAVAFGRDRRTAFSAGSDQTLRIFDVEAGREHDLAATFPLPLNAMALIPPGNGVAVAAGATISIWDISRAGRYVNDGPRVAATRAALASDARNGAALLTLGQWYAFRGTDDWAIDLLTQARAAGAEVPSVALGRCYWRSDQRENAAREFRRAIERNEAPAAYLQLCVSAVEHPVEPAGSPPATTSTTSTTTTTSR
jgi:WD40 repeat protein/class 3 adenylate cyclase